VSLGPIEELVVRYDRAQVAQRVARRRRQLRSQLVSLVITVLLVVGFSVWLSTQGQPIGIVVSVLVVLASFGWVVGSFVLYRRARSELAAVGEGVAIRIARRGAEVGGLDASWSEVAALRIVKGGWGRSPRLELARTTGESATVALDHVTVRAATLDSTARAFSAGRHGVDLEALEA
jgi:hypothetical protein